MVAGMRLLLAMMVNLLQGNQCFRFSQAAAAAAAHPNLDAIQSAASTNTPRLAERRWE